jgi:uncharacterized protein (UPF0332 family)
MGIEEDLRQNIKEFIESGNDDLTKARYNSAVSAYFKAIAVLCDLKIYQERRVLPKNHSERFLFLQMHFAEAYKLIKEIFDKYTDSYNLRLGKRDAELLKTNVERIKKTFEFE